ncbi:GNAT family N-acetyltransferase [Deinococcus fonticola]|uniref:GNAT family N-acetyltransferase n=1 Tax=Deinococcus fonticola TaxID=2528713 RepID=UPI001F0CFD00|nr:GNAT family N-acetyltransferase [Deinococcus fonticola]
MTLHSAFTLRRLGRADLPDFHRVMMQAGMDARSSWNRTTTADLERSLFTDGAGGFVAVDSGGEVVSCVGFGPDGIYTLILNKLAVLPEARGCGLGRQLVAAVEDEARQRGLRRVLLAVSQFNLEVVPFYTALGYAETDEPYVLAYPGSPPPMVMVKAVDRPPLAAVAEEDGR